MKKKILFIVILLLVLCGCKNEETSNHIIHYRDNMNIYDIKEKNNKLEIEKSDIILCIKAPCNPIKEKTYTKDNTKEYKEFIKELFKDKDDNELSITDNDLTDKQKDLLYKIIDKEEELQYKIINTSEYHKDYKDKGYYVTKKDNKTIVTVASGEHSTGGYSIKIVKVSINDKSAVIYVEETSPSDKDMVTEAFTYPTTSVELYSNLDNIKVVDLNTNYEYEKKYDDNV